jgi:predicted nucleic acid-binding protein
VIVADTSVVIARFAAWHEQHDAAVAAVQEGMRLVTHSALEAYSVLTRLPPPHRMSAETVRDFLAGTFPDAPLALSEKAQGRLVDRLVEIGVTGGAAYDALIALTAGDHGAALLTCDRRAQRTYARCGVDVLVL